MANKKDYWTYKEGDFEVSQCAYCLYKQIGDKCTAFPDKIPEKILLNEHDHKKPYPGDHGIRFKRRNKA